MGLVDFMKEAGASFFSSGKKEIDREAIVQSIAEHGFEVENLDLRVDDDVATVSGTARGQSEREKIVLLVGNTKGIARVNDRLEVPPPRPEAPTEPAGSYYEVKSGDSLSKIAKMHYGDAMKYPVIFEANKPMLKDPNKIYPGQVLRIPPQ